MPDGLEARGRLGKVSGVEVGGGNLIGAIRSNHGGEIRARLGRDILAVLTIGKHNVLRLDPGFHFLASRSELLGALFECRRGGAKGVIGAIEEILPLFSRHFSTVKAPIALSRDTSSTECGFPKVDAPFRPYPVVGLDDLGLIFSLGLVGESDPGQVPVGEEKVGVPKPGLDNTEVSANVFTERQVGAVKVPERGRGPAAAAGELDFDYDRVGRENGANSAPKACLGREVGFHCHDFASRIASRALCRFQGLEWKT